MELNYEINYENFKLQRISNISEEQDSYEMLKRRNTKFRSICNPTVNNYHKEYSCFILSERKLIFLFNY
jgi:hypothetical protein